MRRETYDPDVPVAARIRLILLAAFVAVGALAANALGGGTPAVPGWDATLNYDAVQGPGFPRVSNLHLRVTRRGVAVYNGLVPLPFDCRASGCRLVTVGPGRPFQLVDLGSKKGPAALIWLSTGGAHCCTIVRAVSIPDGATAAKNFGNFGARLTTLGASRVFVSADDRFAYLFTSFVSSGLPVQVSRFDHGRFVTVTRAYPATVAEDAARWWHATVKARRARGEARGVFAAWAADECLVGQKTAAQRELASGVAAGLFSPPRGEPSGPAGPQYASALLRKLTAWGYCR